MELIFKPAALEDLKKMDNAIKTAFIAHSERLQIMPPRRHMEHGIPYNVEKVTNNARMLYEIEGKTLYVVRCFSTHKEYERWYKSFK